jgi:hypothetical protein
MAIPGPKSVATLHLMVVCVQENNAYKEDRHEQSALRLTPGKWELMPDIVFIEAMLWNIASRALDGNECHPRFWLWAGRQDYRLWVKR